MRSDALILDAPCQEGVGNYVENLAPCRLHGYLGGGTADYKPTWVRDPRGFWYLSFDGDNDYVDFGNYDSFNLADYSYTIALWFKADAAQSDTNCRLFYRSNGSNAGYWAKVSESDGGITWTHYGGTDLSIAYNTVDYRDAAWHKALFVCDKATPKAYLYVDGTEKATDTGIATLTDNSSSLYFGGAGTSNNFGGGLMRGEIKLRAMDAGEIAADYETERRILGIPA